MFFQAIVSYVRCSNATGILVWDLIFHERNQRTITNTMLPQSSPNKRSKVYGASSKVRLLRPRVLLTPIWIMNDELLLLLLLLLIINLDVLSSLGKHSHACVGGYPRLTFVLVNCIEMCTTYYIYNRYFFLIHCSYSERNHQHWS